MQNVSLLITIRTDAALLNFVESRVWDVRCGRNLFFHKQIWEKCHSAVVFGCEGTVYSN